MKNQYDSIVGKLKLISSVAAVVNKWKKLALRSRDRFYRLRELVQTEQDYYKDLNLIKYQIKQPLLSCAAITVEQANSSLFPNIDSMINLSVELQKQLGEKLQKFDRRATLIGPTMIKFSKFLLVYQQFFTNLKASQNKLQNLIANDKKVRMIQKQLSVGRQIITFQNLMSKPFQRPLKYHLILKDYASKLEQWHADYANLQEAINCYYQVNTQNNEAIENKQKDLNLMQIDLRFGNILNNVARYYVAQYQAVCIDIPVCVYILSDLMVLSNKECASKQTEHMRLYFDKYSHVEAVSDSDHFVNRLFFYGKKSCVHLAFLDRISRNEARTVLSRLIEEANNNESSRLEIISQTSIRQSVPQKRRSYTHLEPQFKRPMRVSVIGNEIRVLGRDKEESYFVIQFSPTPARIHLDRTPTQISLVGTNTVLKIEEMVRRLYPAVTFCSIDHKCKNLSFYDFKKDENKRLQFQNIFLQLQLNTFFRNEQILKRIDVICMLLGMSDAMWLYLKVDMFCQCEGCSSRESFQSVDEFFSAKRKRYVEKNKLTGPARRKKTRVQYCDLRTINTQETLASFEANQSMTGEQRLVWVKSRMGFINHSLTFQSCEFNRISCKVHFCCLSGESIEVEFYANQRVRQVVDLVAQRLGYHMQDYGLAAHINGTVIMLNEDEVLGDLLVSPRKQKNALNSLMGLFKHQEQYKVQIYLRKVWVLEYYIQEHTETHKVHLQVEEIIYRLKHSEFRLTSAEVVEIYSLYYAYRHFSQLESLSLSRMKLKMEQIYNISPYKYRNPDFIQKVYLGIEKIKSKQIAERSSLARDILKKAVDRAGWSCFMFEGYLKSKYESSESLPVRIGCDRKGLKISEKVRTGLMYEMSFGCKNWSCHMNGLDLVIEQEKVLIVTGRDLWKVKQQIDFYRVYYSSFIINQ